MARQQQQYYCFNKNKIRIKSRSFLTLKQERGLFLSLGLGNRNLFWYRDFLSRWEKLSWKMKNVLYFLNHDTLIRTLVSNLLLKLLQGLEKKQNNNKNWTRYVISYKDFVYIKKSNLNTCHGNKALSFTKQNFLVLMPCLLFLSIFYFFIKW